MKIERLDWKGEDPQLEATGLRSRWPDPGAVSDLVADAIVAVRARGDAAVRDLGERFDGVAVERLLVPAERVAEAPDLIDVELRAALETAAANIRAVAQAQPAAMPTSVEPPGGQRIEIAEAPVGSAGIYAPGGRAPYPSSVLMGAIPAVVAGVGRVAVASPPSPSGSGAPDPAVLAAATLAGAHEVYAMGGAQAIAALAYGTESVGRVDVIAGPGGPWVQEAKLQVSRNVGIDGYAGPSELVVVCDGSAPAEWVALDLCAQAEHGDDGLLVAASPDESVLDAVADALEELAPERPSAVDALVLVVRTRDVDGAAELARELAPEHLELACEQAERLAGAITTAGCTFVGTGSATAFGDYAAGSNHVLPTGGAGRFSGPLGPGTFRKRLSRVRLPDAADAALAATVDAIAVAEGFPVHGESARARVGPPAGASSPAERAS